MNKPLTLVFAAALAANLWAHTAPAGAVDATRSMRGADVSAADNAGEAKSYAGRKPGSQMPVARTFSTQPPVIPHAVENFDEITLEENQCLSCHGADVFKKKNAPRIGDSHFVNRDGQKLETTSAARHNCLQCHVPQVDAPPLVENAFKGDVIAPKKRK